MKALIALIFVVVSISCPAVASAAATGSISGPTVATDYDTGVTTISVSDLVVNTDCQPGFHNEVGWPLFPVAYTVTGCGAAAYVVDRRYRDGSCPYFNAFDEDYSLIRSAWFVPAAAPPRTLSSGPGSAEAPPTPVHEDEPYAFTICLYQTEERNDSGTENSTGYEGIYHTLVAELTVDAPPSLSCVDARVEYQKAKAKLAASIAAVKRAGTKRSKARQEFMNASKEAKKAKGLRKLKLKRKVKAKQRAVTKAQREFQIASIAVSDADRHFRTVRQQGSRECGIHPIEG